MRVKAPSCKPDVRLLHQISVHKVWTQGDGHANRRRDILFTFMFVMLPTSVHAVSGDKLDVRLVTDQAEAALHIIELAEINATPGDDDWNRLWNSEGYRRLLEREASMGRDKGFAQALAAWLVSPETVAKADEYRELVDEWQHFDARAAGLRALAYLPGNTFLQASLYPVLKHTSNTFVFDLENQPSIFMTLSIDDDAAKIEATMTHELHHVGIAQCPVSADYQDLSGRQKWVVDRLGIFGEGLAVLATAGGPMRHPQYFGSRQDYLVWERDIARFTTDLPRIEQFFSEVLAGEIAESQQRARLMEFIVSAERPQGPAYTVGWKMAAIVERKFGQDSLVEVICDPRELMRKYNEAIATMPTTDNDLPIWSAEFLSSLH